MGSCQVVHRGGTRRSCVSLARRSRTTPTAFAAWLAALIGSGRYWRFWAVMRAAATLARRSRTTPTAFAAWLAALIGSGRYWRFWAVMRVDPGDRGLPAAVLRAAGHRCPPDQQSWIVWSIGRTWWVDPGDRGLPAAVLRAAGHRCPPDQQSWIVWSIGEPGAAGRHHQPRGDRKPRAWRQCGPQNGPRRSQAITPEPGAAGRHHQPRGDRKPRAWRQCGPQNGPRRSQPAGPPHRPRAWLPVPVPPVPPVPPLPVKMPPSALPPAPPARLTAHELGYRCQFRRCRRSRRCR